MMDWMGRTHVRVPVLVLGLGRLGLNTGLVHHRALACNHTKINHQVARFGRVRSSRAERTGAGSLGLHLLLTQEREYDQHDETRTTYGKPRVQEHNTRQSTDLDLLGGGDVALSAQRGPELVVGLVAVQHNNLGLACTGQNAATTSIR